MCIDYGPYCRGFAVYKYFASMNFTEEGSLMDNCFLYDYSKMKMAPQNFSETEGYTWEERQTRAMYDVDTYFVVQDSWRWTWEEDFVSCSINLNA